MGREALVCRIDLWKKCGKVFILVLTFCIPLCYYWNAESEVKKLSPRTGRPREENAKRSQIVVRLDDTDMQRLDACAERLKLTRAETMRIGLRTLYEDMKKE